MLGRKRARADGGDGRGRFKSDSSRMRWMVGQQKYFAKAYRGMSYQDPYRQVGRALMGTDFASADPSQKRVRRAIGYYGPGDYRKYLKMVPGSAYSYAGHRLGQMTGIPGMGYAGAAAGKALHKFVSGYGTSENQIIGGSNKGQISVNEDNLTGDIYITQTEFVQNVSASNSVPGASPFQIVSFPINPGLNITFPFLSQIAQNYTLYEFDGLMFKFNPTSGENNASSNSLGKVILATNYDPEAADFVNSVQMENYDYANAAKPSQVIIHGVETKNSQQTLNMQYVRTGTSTKSKLFTDLGTFYVATEGIPFGSGGTQVLGELWVTYRIKLSRAQLYNSSLGAAILWDYQTAETNGSALINPSLKTGRTLPCTFSQVSTTTFRLSFPKNINLGSYLVILRKGVVADGNHWSAIGSQNHCTTWFPGLFLPGAGSTFVNAPATGTALNTSTIAYFGITVQAPGNLVATVDITYSANVTNGSIYRLWVTQVDQSISTTLS